MKSVYSFNSRLVVILTNCNGLNGQVLQLTSKKTGKTQRCALTNVDFSPRQLDNLSSGQGRTERSWGL